MCKVNIAETHFYIKQVIGVIKSHNPNHHKVLSRKSRHSDVFVYILSGSCTYTADGKEMTAKAGDILYLARGSDYDMYIHDDRYRFIFCDFTFDSPIARSCAVFSVGNPSYAENLFIKLLNAYHSDEAAAFADTLSLLYSIYALINRSHTLPEREKTRRTRIQEAKRYIDLHFMDLNLGVCALAEDAEMSEVYFRKLFKETFGQSPSQYITSVRLSKARELMRYPFLSLEECALQSGFSSQQYFCKIFKEHLGITPAKYRGRMNSE